jgi:hypothetical protein
VEHALPPHARVHRLVLVTFGLGLLVVLLGGLVVWQLWHPPELSYARALGALDATLAQQWSGFPKPVQEVLSGTYGRLGLASPGERQRK